MSKVREACSECIPKREEDGKYTMYCFSSGKCPHQENREVDGDILTVCTKYK